MDSIDDVPAPNTYRISYKYFLIYLCTAIISILVTVIQVIYSQTSRNLIYLAECCIYGPLHFIAALLALSISIFIV